MISQWLAGISEYTGNLSPEASVAQVRLEGCQPSDSTISSEGMNAGPEHRGL
jgi:hypothetical protein